MKKQLVNETPLFNAAKRYADSAPARFHTPGHKGSKSAPCAFLGKEMLNLDLTELPETDSLFAAGGAILNAELLAASAFGMVHTLMSAGGATLCIQAMLRLVTQAGKKKVVMARNIHRSAVNAAILLGIEPIWVWPRGFEGSTLPGVVSPEDVEKELSKEVNAAAVYLTSPDYYGVISDIKGIAGVCCKYRVPLIVDNAHGSHLLCLSGGIFHPARLGASMTCDSAHKTLPVLTGGAWLQISSGFDKEDAKQAMALFGSTSPSYPVMISLDIARAWIQNEGRAAFDKLSTMVNGIEAACNRLGFFKPNAFFDPVRITIDTASAGLSGGKAALWLREKGISSEMHDDRHVVLLPSPFNTEKDFKRLEEAIKSLPLSTALKAQAVNPERPIQFMTPREAAEAQGETVEIERCAGKIAAECACPCPPGIPLVIPGERISEIMAISLKKYGVSYIKVVR